MTCAHTGPLPLTAVPGPPDENRGWFIERCNCGAVRLAEHEDNGDEILVRSATPWRGGKKRLDIVERRQRVVALRNAGHTMRHIASECGVSLGTIANDLLEAT